MEAEQADWKKHETQLADAASSAAEQRRLLETERNKLQDQISHLERQAKQSKEDCLRAEERLKTTTSDLQSRLTSANSEAKVTAQKQANVDKEVQDLRQQLFVLDKTSKHHEESTRKRDAEVKELNEELARYRSTCQQASKEISQLREKLASTERDAVSYQEEGSRATEAQEKAEAEMRQLQVTLATKESEDEKRNAAIRRMSEQIEQLQAQEHRLQEQFDTSQRASSQKMAQMTSQLEESVKQRDTAIEAHKSQSRELSDLRIRTKSLDSDLSAANRLVASTENELKNIRVAKHEADQRISTLSDKCESLDQQLQHCREQLRQQEDVAFSSERERQSLAEQLTKVKSLLDAESKQKITLEHDKARSERDLSSLQQRLSRQERQCAELQNELDGISKALSDSRALENKTTIEHVHTLEKAMKVQDRQLADAQAKMEDAQQLIRALEKTKNRLTAELQDVAFATQHNTTTSRSKDRQVGKLEESVKKAQESLDRERRAREVADASTEKMKGEMRSLQVQLQDALSRASHLEKTKANLQHELNAASQRNTSPSFSAHKPASSSNGSVVNGKKQQLLDELAKNNAQMSDQIDQRQAVSLFGFFGKVADNILEYRHSVQVDNRTGLLGGRQGMVLGGQWTLVLRVRRRRRMLSCLSELSLGFG